MKLCPDTDLADAFCLIVLLRLLWFVGRLPDHSKLSQ